MMHLLVSKIEKVLHHRVFAMGAFLQMYPEVFKNLLRNKANPHRNKFRHYSAEEFIRNVELRPLENYKMY